MRQPTEPWPRPLPSRGKRPSCSWVVRHSIRWTCVVLCSRGDILLADVSKLRSITEEKGISIKYFEYDDMLHAWVLFNLPESKMAIEQTAGLINSNT